jgi:putative ABC transport system permease protein
MKEWFADARLDFRFAARTSAKRPGFTLVVVMTLALGISATATVFSIVDAVLLRPLPYRDSSRLVAVWATSVREEGLAKIFASHEDYAEFRRHAKTLESVSAATWAGRPGQVLTGFGPAREVLTIPATVSFFETLGVGAKIGRTFAAGDETQGCSIVVAHKFWTSVLGADPALVGRSVEFNQKPCTVLGVMPEEFSFYPPETQAWILIGPNFVPDLNKLQVGIFARLKPGVTIAQAQAELRSLYRASRTDLEAHDLEPVVYDLQGEFTFLAGRTLRTTLMLVFGAVLLVLLIACLNVANLLLARLTDRRRELAVRAALGSGQGRLVRQVLTEGLLLAGIGGAVGVGITYAAVRAYRLANPIELSVGADVKVNLAVLGFSVALSFATALIFALLPALRASRVDLTQSLKASGRGSVQGRHGWARVLIAVEMALSFVLLIGAGLLMTSALKMGGERLGFNPDGMAATRVSLPGFRYSTESQRLLAYDRLLERLESLPGVTGVALASKVPPEAGGNQALEIQGGPVVKGNEMHDTGADAVSPGFFDVLNIALLRGRAFNAQDRDHSPPVAIINDALVREYFPHENPLGQQIRLSGGTMPWLTIVGVSGNLKHTQLMNEMSWVETPILYRPLAQEPRPAIQVAVRASGDVGLMAGQIQKQIAAVDSAIPMNDVEMLSARLAKTLAYPRFRAVVLAFFAVGALLLSAVGLHGVLAQLVAQRMPEFGVRRAVGAQEHDLLLLIVRQGGGPVLIGLAVGLSLAVAFGRVISRLLYGVQTADAGVLAAAALTLVMVAGLAIVLPAVRAARVDPMVALREE